MHAQNKYQRNYNLRVFIIIEIALYLDKLKKGRLYTNEINL